MKNLAGKVVLVTGGASGLGKAIVERLAEEHSRVVVADIDAGNGAAVARAAQGTFVRTDVSKAADVEAAVAYAVDTCGRLDVMVNNAGIECPQTPLHEVAPAAWQKLVDVNLGGVFFGLKYAIAQFLRQGEGGVIVNMASIAGLVGFPDIAPYDAAKAGVCNLTRAAAVEYGAHRIRVNAVAPTAVATDMHRRQTERAADPAAFRERMMSMNPLRGMPTPEDVAAAVAFLASDDAAFISGAILPVDGAYTAR